MPEGSLISRTADELAGIDAYVRSLDGVEDVATFVGQGPLRFLLTYEPQMPDSAYGQLIVTVDDHRRIPELRAHLTAYLEAHQPGRSPASTPSSSGRAAGPWWPA